MCVVLFLLACSDAGEQRAHHVVERAQVAEARLDDGEQLVPVALVEALRLSCDTLGAHALSGRVCAEGKCHGVGRLVRCVWALVCALDASKRARACVTSSPPKGLSSILSSVPPILRYVYTWRENPHANSQYRDRGCGART